MSSDKSTSPAATSGPLVAYVLLWFPLSSETFIFREICQLVNDGMNIAVYTLYGPSLKGCSEEMKAYSGCIHRFGIRAIWRICRAFARALVRQPRLVSRLMRQGLFRRMRNLESFAENAWAFFAGFLLAEECKRSHVALIHSSWANGPATAAWIASTLSGIPFAFTGRAGDIYPEDGLLREKSHSAAFIRTNNAANVAWLQSFCPDAEKGKVRLVYNSFFFRSGLPKDPVLPAPPYRILAVGRFVRTKGFPFLLTAMARLKREKFPAQLTIVGDGAWRRKLEKLCRKLELLDCVSMPGFLPNDQLAKAMSKHDLLVVPSVVHENGDRDGIPNVIMEALSLGLPVVATDVCGISEVIENHATGYLVPQRNAGALAWAIRQSLENWPRTVTMTSAGRARVFEMFDPHKNSSALKKLYAGAMRTPDNAVS